MQKIPKGIRDTISYLLCMVVDVILMFIFIIIGVGMVSLLEIIGWDTTGTITIVIGFCIWLWFITVDATTEIIVDKLY